MMIESWHNLITFHYYHFMNCLSMRNNKYVHLINCTVYHFPNLMIYANHNKYIKIMTQKLST